jgi:hypothetical protein
VTKPRIPLGALLANPYQGLAIVAIGYRACMNFLLWLLAVILVVAGIVQLLRRNLLWGVLLIIIGLLIGPGGVSIFH